MIEDDPHREARNLRDEFREQSVPIMAERFENEYFQLIGEGAEPDHARNIASIAAMVDESKELYDSQDFPESDDVPEDIDVPDATAEDIFQFDSKLREARELAGLPAVRDSNDVTDAEDLPSIEQLSDAADSDGN